MDRAGSGWTTAALAWTIVIGLMWLVVPVGSSASTTSLSDGTEVVDTSRETLVQVEGVGVLVLLAVPVVLAAVAVAASRSRHVRRVRFVTAAVLLAACVLAAASIGLFYAPAAVGLLAGAVKSRERTAA